MVLIEDILFNLKERLNNNNINLKDIDNYMDVYSLDVEDLERLLDINWNDKIILKNLIKAFSSNDEYKQDKIELLTFVSDKLDIKNDKEKILACASIINSIESFKDDKDCLKRIVNKFTNSKTEQGALVSKKIARDVLEFINELDCDERAKFGLRVRLSEIIGFITREEEKYKIDAMEQVSKIYPKNKLGELGGIFYSISKSENSNQTSTIIDIANNKGLQQKKLTLKACLCSSKLSDEKLLDLYQVLDCSNEMSEAELNDEIEYIMSKEEIEKQRKISANK